MTTITYTQVGDYLLPDLLPPERPVIGLWGKRRLQYLIRKKEWLYTLMLMNGQLKTHLEEIDAQAQEMADTLLSQMAKQENVTEQLKATNPLKWVAMMNSIQARVNEIVFREWIDSEN